MDSAAATNTQDLLPLVRRTAEQLNADLERARALTKDWSLRDETHRHAAEAMQRCLDRLSATECWGTANRTLSSELWRICETWLSRGDLQRHARLKPRGYAGDFSMLAKICQHDCCTDPLGEAFDRFFQNQAAPEAVRNRTSIIARAIADRRPERREFHIASVGSGPAIDIEQGLQQLHAAQRRGVRVTLWDMDPAALEHAQLRLAQLLPADQISPMRENLYRLPRRAPSQDAGMLADVVFCAGLFDYLEDDDAADMLRFLWRSLNVGGELLAFNFSHRNPSRAYMEWIGNWYLIYHTPKDMAALAIRAGLPKERYTVHSEPTGVNLYLRANRQSHETP